MNFKIKKSTLLHKGKVFDLKVDKIEYDSGNEGIREVVMHNGGAVVVPLTNEGKIVMVTQYRYPLNKTLLEFPAGKLNEGEDPFLCAIRELQEETGYKSGNMEKLGEICTAPGYCTEILHIYAARELQKGNHNREEGEYGMEIKEFTVDEVEKKIKSGEITDAKTICGLYLLKSNIDL